MVGGGSLGVARPYRRHWPVVFCYTAPEYPYRTNGEGGKKGLEQSSIDLPIRGLADMSADDVLEYLAYRE